MKRNHPPSDTECDQVEENRLIEERIKTLFAKPCDRKVLLTNKGHWLSDLSHARLETSMNAHQYDGLVVNSRELGYSYLEAHQALYLLESGQLLLCYNEIPLSIAEAYQVLLQERHDLVDHSVFTHLNRSGYFCFKSDIKPPDEPTSSIDEGKPMISEELCKPLVNIESTSRLVEEISDHLQQAGQKRVCNRPTSSQAYRFKFTFDIYKRETFHKNKIRNKDKTKGVPDYHVIVCDKLINDSSPSGNELSRLFESSDTDRVRFSAKILFALVAADCSLSFVHYDRLDADEELALSPKSKQDDLPQ